MLIVDVCVYVLSVCMCEYVCMCVFLARTAVALTDLVDPAVLRSEN